ncbi:hypothetical protein GHO40_22120 [Pseudomonas helleri]|uniref:Uncharacterized protein n=1 Tax=Pseudomonas helleri TaxID=1608996 RepID=A0A7X2C2A5_9PSED|nr:hypothetical protein [Pseudomonas helleri]MQT49402.1 hypothetical protein [Pseudomonas helleri]MQT88203.1 hypothetical protein [Pseudomonas helleri]
MSTNARTWGIHDVGLDVQPLSTDGLDQLNGCLAILADIAQNDFLASFGER